MAVYQEEIVKEIHVNCPAPSCQSGEIKKSGRRYGDQYYTCKKCGKRFSLNNKAEGKRFQADWVGLAINNYLSGMSYANVARSMAIEHGIHMPARSTVYRWIREYGHKLTHAMKDQKVPSSGHWVADEMEIDAGCKNLVYHWNIMDAETRYVLATHVSEVNSIEEAAVVIGKALAVADQPPKTFKTDGNKSYIKAAEGLLPNTKHIVSDGAIFPYNNNMSERLQGSYRERIKTLRALYTVATAQEYLDAFTAHYNFFRPHSGIGNITPAKAAGVEVPFTSWTDVVNANIDAPPLANRKRKAKVETARKRSRKRFVRERIEAAQKPNKRTRKRIGKWDGSQAPLLNTRLGPFKWKPRDSAESKEVRRERKRKLKERRKENPQPDLSRVRMDWPGRQHSLGENKYVVEFTTTTGGIGRAKMNRQKADAPKPVMPKIGQGKPKRPGESLTEQIVQQMHPRPPTRRRRR